MIGIFINPGKVAAKTRFLELFRTVKRSGLEFSVNTEVKKIFGEGYKYESVRDLVNGKKFVIAIGGDGTFLKMLHDSGSIDNKYVLANIGRIGFLASFTLEELIAGFKQILSDHDKYIPLSLLETGHGPVKDFALNDIVFENEGRTRLLDFKVYLDNEFYHLLRASGLIVSTPAGSSAICYSSGGPIVEAGLDLMIYKAISPQFNSEPSLVFNGYRKLTVVNGNDFPIIYTVDGLITKKMGPGEKVTVTTMKHKKCNLILFKSKNISTILKEKIFNRD